ncbi:hypothetical protein SKAU_G00067300 [Synaphobranchus kaupii]|uniref:Uncharacterized protein n=1 Tax=Synaphobranchus kaupii TaxID=118154 RepID=A0A9Q1G696_SYNKA|nr:hypothetical protein SKAU_G00067300 [Synaphobranchus kaupii]
MQGEAILGKAPLKHMLPMVSRCVRGRGGPSHSVNMCCKYVSREADVQPRGAASLVIQGSLGLKQFRRPQAQHLCQEHDNPLPTSIAPIHMFPINLRVCSSSKGTKENV